MITKRQKEVFDCITSFFTTHERMPQYREVGQLLHTHHGNIYRLVSELCKSGHLIRYGSGRAARLEITNPNRTPKVYLTVDQKNVLLNVDAPQQVEVIIRKQQNG